MSIDIKTMSVEPKRQTFAHVARRLGGDAPASRYEEGVYDLQATTHFHYRPIWGPEFWTRITSYNVCYTKLLRSEREQTLKRIEQIACQMEGY